MTNPTIMSGVSSIRSNDVLSSYRKRLVNQKVDLDADGFDTTLYRFACAYLRKDYASEFFATKKYLDELRDEYGYKFGRRHYNYDNDSMKSHKSIKLHASLFEESNPPNRRWMRSVKSAVKKLSKINAKLHPHYFHTIDDVSDMIQDWDTSAGFLYVEDPHFVNNRVLTKKSEYLDKDILTTASEELEKAKVVGSFRKPYLIASRIQSSGEFTSDGEPTKTFKTKTRMVWIEHLIVLLYERVFSIPAGEYMMDSPHTFLGKSDDWITRTMQWARRHYYSWWSLDFSNYDARVPAWLISAAFEVLSNWFVLTEDDKQLLKILEHDYIYKTVILGRESDDLSVSKGEPSGSGFTSIIGNLCHWIMNEAAKEALNVDFYYITMNDDNICFSRESGEVAKAISNSLLSYDCHNFGMVGNFDEIDCQDFGVADPCVLSRVWTDKGPTREKHALISRMFFPENHRKYKSGRAKVEWVFYSYVLGYAKAMGEMFNLAKFYNDYPLSFWKTGYQQLTAAEVKELPWNMRNYLEYQYRGRVNI